RDERAFIASTEHAQRLARDGYLVTYGIPPSAPETGFGYIERGTPLDDQGACAVARFVEKPDLATAAEYLQSGRFLWNSGMFCFSAGTVLRELREYAPEIVDLAEECLANSPAHESAGVLLQ